MGKVSQSGATRTQSCSRATRRALATTGRRPGPDQATLFERAAHNGQYNEIILDSGRWDSSMPDAVEAIYYTAGTPMLQIVQYQHIHANFLAAYPQLDAASNPL